MTQNKFTHPPKVQARDAVIGFEGFIVGPQLPPRSDTIARPYVVEIRFYRAVVTRRTAVEAYTAADAVIQVELKLDALGPWHEDHQGNSVGILGDGRVVSVGPLIEKIPDPWPGPPAGYETPSGHGWFRDDGLEVDEETRSCGEWMTPVETSRSGLCPGCGLWTSIIDGCFVDHLRPDEPPLEERVRCESSGSYIVSSTWVKP